MKKRIVSFALWAILLSLALVLAYLYFFMIEKPALNMRIELHRQIVRADAPSPYQYRILIPYVAEGLWYLGKKILPEHHAFALTYIFINITALFLFIWVGFHLLTEWYHPEYALIGTLFITAVMPITFFDHYFQPWSFWEALFYNMALLMILRQRWVWLGIIILLAALNRETSLVILPTFVLTGLAETKFLCWRKWNWNRLPLLVLYILLWSTVFISLRLIRPPTPHVETIAQIWQFNIQPQNIIHAGINWMLFLGGFWPLALIGYPRAPSFLKRAAWVLVFHLPLILIWGYWREVRMLILYYFVLVGLGLAALPRSLKSFPSSTSHISLGSSSTEKRSASDSI